MEDTIVSRKPDGTYKATFNGRTIATGDTQNEAGWNGQEKRPNAAVVAQRVRDLGVKHEDQFRRLYPITVSYTHLDVYKRQGLLFPKTCAPHRALLL